MPKTIRATIVLTMLAGAAWLYGDDQKPHSVIQDAATGKLKPAKIQLPNGTARTAPFFSSGLLNAAKHALDTSPSDMRLEESDFASGASIGHPDIGIGKGTLGCSERGSGESSDDGDARSVRVNQDCTFRRQAEEKIVFNPANPDNLVAGQNDSRVGFNQCGIDFSKDNGAHWGDLLPPFRQKINNPDGQIKNATDPNSHTIVGGPGTFHTYDAGSDPAPAFDSRGRAFFSCIAFDVFSNAPWCTSRSRRWAPTAHSSLTSARLTGSSS
jgi:hypothetical protein